MESFFARYKNPLVLALVLMAQFVLLAVQVRPRLPGAAAADQAGVKVLRMGVTTVVAPPEKVLHSGGLSLRSIWSSYLDLIDLKQQNEQLLAENQRLQLEQAALAEDARQGQRLQELLAFKQHYVDGTVPAQVVGAGGSDHGRVLYIDKGADDGLAEDMPVITPDGIVGRIRDVMPHTSQVLEISDPTSAAGVLLEETRTRGVLRGNGFGQPEIVNIMPDDRIRPGQLVLTSGGDQIFPRGLPVGTVLKIVPDVEDQPLVDVVLKPAANLGRLEEVLVITGTVDEPSARSKHDLTRSEGTAAALKAAAEAKASDAAEAAVEAQRASDILAQRLPSANNVTDPDAPDAAPGSSPATADSIAAPLHPPSALHADHFSPGDEPSAEDLAPGARLAPYAQGNPEAEQKARAAAVAQGDAALPSLSVSPAFRAAHEAAMAARPHPPAPARAASAQASSVGNHPTAVEGATAGTHSSAVNHPAGTAAAPPTTVPVRAQSGARVTHPEGTAPEGTRPATPTRLGAAAPHHSVQTQIVTDGPDPAHKAEPRAETPKPVTPKPVTPKPLNVVPDDGSRPPAQPLQSTTPPQEQR
jgi:rod shape-determining protein MreC